MKKLNLTGETYNRLTVIKIAPNNSRGRSCWECKCSCGTIKIIAQEDLRDGSTKSCGCLNNEKRSARAKAMYSVNIKYSSASEATARQIWRKTYKRELSFEDFLEISQLPCYYCGVQLSNSQNSARQDSKSSQQAKDEGDFIYNGLDRIDSNLIHTKENCVPCCKKCNFSKSNRDIFEFALWITRVYNFWGKSFNIKYNNSIQTENDYLW